jgi:hypothetical protein
VLVIELLSVAGESGSPRENRREESSDENDDYKDDWAGRPGVAERNASFWADNRFSLRHDPASLAAQKQRRVSILSGPGSETVNSCARTIRLIRELGIKRLFLETF